MVHDDGRAPSMYDLRVGPADAPEVAIECVGAVDPVFTETWNVGPAKGPLLLDVTGNWHVVIAPEASVKAVKLHVERLIKALEERGIDNLHVDHWLKWGDAALFEEFDSLKITQAYSYQQQGTGKVYLNMTGIGGAVDEQGLSIPKWVGQFLRDPHRKDVLYKLQRSGAPERHVFVIVTFAGAPWEVESYLSGELEHLPDEAPDLPEPVTGVWLVSGMGRRGLCWQGVVWQHFDSRGEGIDS